MTSSEGTGSTEREPKGITFRLRPGMPVECTDGPWGELDDIVVEPLKQRVTHIVVQPHHRHDQSRLVAIAAIESCTDRIALSMSGVQVDESPRVEDSDFLSLGTSPRTEDGWTVGVTRSLAWPYYQSIGMPMGLGLGAGGQEMMATTFDRVPAGTVEIRRASEVISSDEHLVGHVDGFIIGDDDVVTHVVLAHGHLWGQREITIPIADVERVQSDRIRLGITRDALGGYPSVPFHRHPHQS